MATKFSLRMTNPIDKARQCGTLNLLDRSKQYEDSRQIDQLRSLNEAWSKIRLLESAGIKKDAAMADLREKLRKYKYVNTALTAIITALAFKGLEVLFQAIR
ncbi:MAG: hypothetical protein ACRD20_20560 [Terriglobales bacterium]